MFSSLKKIFPWPMGSTFSLSQPVYLPSQLVLRCSIILLSLTVFFEGLVAMSSSEREILKHKSKEMFFHAYNSYMNHAYPADELMPLSCKGRYRGSEPPRGDIDDALGNYSLSLIDSLDTLFLMNAREEFERAVDLVIRNVSFDQDVVVSVFEVNIRLVGGLLGGHVGARILQQKGLGMLRYKDELLHLAEDLGRRLLPAFNTSTGIPYPRVNLRHGLNSRRVLGDSHTCTACAGSMLLEFAALSRLTGHAEFETRAKRAIDYLWEQRNLHSDLVGNVLNIHTGEWVRRESGVGAGTDSYYEYLLKAYILLGDPTYLQRFQRHYAAIHKYVNNNAASTASLLPLLVDVHMHRPSTKAKQFVDALHAFWPAVQVLAGDVEQAIAVHEVLNHVVQRHLFLPEAFTVHLNVHWPHHPLRPEFLESTYFLHRATGDAHYLRIGAAVLRNLESYARVKCGFAAIRDVRTMHLDDQMDSYVLAETFKYLYLLFADERHDLPVQLSEGFLFTTEAHLLPLALEGFAMRDFSSSTPNVSISASWSRRENGALKRECRNPRWSPVSESVPLEEQQPKSKNEEEEEEEEEKSEEVEAIKEPMSLVEFLLNMSPKKEGWTAALATFPEKCLPLVQRIRASLHQLLHQLYPNEPYQKARASSPNPIPPPLELWAPFSTPNIQYTGLGIPTFLATSSAFSFMLKADKLNVQNPMHVETLRWMGIHVIMGSDGNTRLHHVPTHAISEILAQEGAKFMNDLLRLQQRINSASEVIESRYVVPLLPFYRGRLQLRAGVSRFSPFPEPRFSSDLTLEQLNHTAMSTSNISNFGVLGPLVMYPGVDSLACNAQEELPDREIMKLKGSVVMVRRGGCMFVEKARVLMRYGAVGGIVVDVDRPGTSIETQGTFAMSGDDRGDVTLPCVFLFTAEATQLTLLKEQAEARKGGHRLWVLLTKVPFAAEVLHFFAQRDLPHPPEQEVTPEVSSQPTESFVSSESLDTNQITDLLKPVPVQSYQVHYTLQEVRHINDDPKESGESAPPVSMELQREDVEQDHEELCTYDSTSQWRLTVHFNMGAAVFRGMFQQHGTTTLSEEEVEMLRPLVHLMQLEDNVFPNSLRGAMMHFFHRLFEVISQEGDRLTLQEQPSMEKVLEHLQTAWLTRQATTKSMHNTHTLQVNLRLANGHCWQKAP